MNGNVGQDGRSARGGRDGQEAQSGNDGKDGAAGSDGLVKFSDEEKGAFAITCDLRIVKVSDGSAVAQAGGGSGSDDLKNLASVLARRLRGEVLVKGEPIAVVSLRNRSGSAIGRVIADEIADKLTGELIGTKWFAVKDRIDLRAILDEKDLEKSKIVRSLEVQRKLAGVKYIVVGGVTAGESVVEPRKSSVRKDGGSP